MKIAIIGSGIIGVATAYYLHKNGHEISVYDQYADSAQGTTHANAGLLTPSFSAPWNAPGILWTLLGQLVWPKPYMSFPIKSLPSHFIWGLNFLSQARPKTFHKNTQCLTDLAMYSRECMTSLLEDIPIAFEYEQSGLLILFNKDKALKSFDENVKTLKSFVKDYDILNTSQTITKEPSIENYVNHIKGSLYFPTEAKGDARVFTQQLAKILKEQGVQFFYNSPIELKKQSQSKVLMIHNQQEVLVDKIVLAAGPQSAKIAKRVGIKLPIKPCKGHSITLNTSAFKNVPRIPMIDHASHTAITPLGDKLRVTSFAEFVGDNPNIKKAHIKRLIKYVNQAFKPNTDFSIDNVNPWAGLRPLTYDGLPIIGNTCYQNLFLNTGHGPGGWTLGLGSGKLMADLILENRRELDIEPFQLNRFH